MAEHPILMNAPMVRATLAGTKTQTRRLVKPKRLPDGHWMVETRGTRHELTHWDNDQADTSPIACPYGQPGDRLWVRESTEADYDTYDAVVLARYCADRATVMYTDEDDGEPIQAAAHWDYPRDVRPSIHMKREQARITLEITRVRVERLQDIGEADAVAEGVAPQPTCRPDDDTAAFSRIGRVHGDSFPIARYAALWEHINGPGSWAANPWVWVVEFKRAEGGAA